MSQRNRDLLEKQIIKDGKDGDTTVLAELLAMLDEEVMFEALSDENQYKTNFQQLKGGEHIVALKTVKGVSNSYSTPEEIFIKEGAMLQVPHSGTRMGDCFTNLVVGDAVKTCRGHNEGENKELERGDVVGLSEGYNTAPYSLGQIDLRVWKIIKE